MHFRLAHRSFCSDFRGSFSFWKGTNNHESWKLDWRWHSCCWDERIESHSFIVTTLISNERGDQNCWLVKLFKYETEANKFGNERETKSYEILFKYKEKCCCFRFSLISLFHYVCRVHDAYIVDILNEWKWMFVLSTSRHTHKKHFKMKILHKQLQLDVIRIMFA